MRRLNSVGQVVNLRRIGNPPAAHRCVTPMRLAAMWGRMLSCVPVVNRRTASIAAASLLALGVLTAPAPPADPIFQAMRDEIDRARKLSLANLEAPYFVEYVIDEQETFTVTASLGGLLS